MLARSQWFSFCIGLTNSVQPYCMFESMTVHATIKASCAQRLTDASARDGVMSFNPRPFREIRHRGSNATRPVRHIQKGQSHFYTGERAGEHQLVETPEVADTEDAARHLTQARS